MTSPDYVPDVLAWVRSQCLELPEARTDQPFGPDFDAFRIHKRIFALLSAGGPGAKYPLLNLKADPEEVTLLQSTHSWIIPGYHMNKKHWVSVVLGPDVNREFIGELIEDSYDTVASKLPVALRPKWTPGGDRSGPLTPDYSVERGPQYV